MAVLARCEVVEARDVAGRTPPRLLNGQKVGASPHAGSLWPRPMPRPRAPGLKGGSGRLRRGCPCSVITDVVHDRRGCRSRAVPFVTPNGAAPVAGCGPPRRMQRAWTGCTEAVGGSLVLAVRGMRRAVSARGAVTREVQVGAKDARVARGCVARVAKGRAALCTLDVRVTSSSVNACVATVAARPGDGGCADVPKADVAIANVIGASGRGVVPITRVVAVRTTVAGPSAAKATSATTGEAAVATVEAKGRADVAAGAEAQGPEDITAAFGAVAAATRACVAALVLEAGLQVVALIATPIWRPLPHLGTREDTVGACGAPKGGLGTTTQPSRRQARRLHHAPAFRCSGATLATHLTACALRWKFEPFLPDKRDF